jgi:16S rRNA (cytidine(1402)-2'-O)-methyltransferase
LPAKPFYFVTIGIGNSQDLTLRAHALLKSTPVLIAEELKPARKLLKELGRRFYEGEFEPLRKEAYLFAVDENVSAEDLEYLRSEVFPRISEASYISGAGSPLFEDPGSLIQPCLKGFRVERIPGVTSLGALMMYFPSRLKSFSMQGFLPPKTELRRRVIREIAKQETPTFLMETPYRRNSLLEDLQHILPHWKVVFGYKLTTADQKIFEGPILEIARAVKDLPKGEFVLLIYPH